MAKTIGNSVDAIELNISCPNVKEGCVAFGTVEKSVAEVTEQVKKHCKVPLIVKLSPNVTDIVTIARTAEAYGADAISLINTLTGMVIDIKNRRPLLANITGGLSGPAVKPVAVRMVYEVYQAVKVPIIGMGGICKWEDGVEFMLAGADAIQIGTASFADPFTMNKVIEGIAHYCESNGFDSVTKLKGNMNFV